MKYTRLKFWKNKTMISKFWILKVTPNKTLILVMLLLVRLNAPSTQDIFIVKINLYFVKVALKYVSNVLWWLNFIKRCATSNLFFSRKLFNKLLPTESFPVLDDLQNQKIYGKQIWAWDFSVTIHNKDWMVSELSWRK